MPITPTNPFKGRQRPGEVITDGDAVVFAVPAVMEYPRASIVDRKCRLLGLD
jgi:hypothetical protein